MRTALLSVLLAIPLCAQQGGVDLVRVGKLAAHPKITFRALKTEPLALLGSTFVLGAANGLDYLTTQLGPGQHPGQYCEQIVTTGQRCQLDQRKFDWLKGGIAIFDAVQWTPVFAFPNWKHQQTYQATMVLIDAAAAVPMLKGVGGNLGALQKGGTIP